MKKTASLALLTLLLCLAQPLYAALPGQLPVVRIQVAELTPLQVGLETGRQVKALYPDIEQRYDAWLATLFKRSELAMILRQQLPVLLRQMDQSSRDELQGVSASWALSSTNKLGDGQLSLDEYHLLNLLPDLGLLPNGIGFGVYNQATTDGNPIVGRNLDWASNAELRSLQVITVYERKQRSFATIGLAGMVSMLSGFNDRGLFISLLNAEPYSPYSHHNRFESLPPGSFWWRKTLETHTTVAEAARYLADKKYTFAYSALLADKKTVQVLEYSPQKNKGRIRHWHSPLNRHKTWEHPHQIAAVNCLMLAAMPDTCGSAIDTVRWQRLNELATSAPSQLTDTQTMSRILLDRNNRRYELFSTATLQSFYYLPASNSLYLYTQPLSGEHPESPLHQPYLDLLTPAEDWKLALAWVIWPLLLLKLSVTLWLGWKHKNRFYRKKDIKG